MAGAGSPSLGVPEAMTSRRPPAWLQCFGPGAIIASLTIGAGELIFSSRAGALFGYRVLWFFAVVLALKWVLVFAAARHMVLTGAHPFQRWVALPGPRGWLPMVFVVLAMGCFPVWVCFHAGAIGTLVSHLAGTDSALRGGAHFVWGAGVLGLVLGLSLVGGYGALERIQLVIVLLMLGCVVGSLVWVGPDWGQWLAGFVVPRGLEYPAWVQGRAEFASRPVWVEAITYVGVLGGSGYDYLAYVSFLRDKRWGPGGGVADADQLRALAADPTHADRRWLRVLWIDCTLSFAAVLVFSAVFVACGAVLLAPAQLVPAGSNLLDLQAAFVERMHPGLKPLYFGGALLTLLGTLYGTIEVAPAVLREALRGLAPDAADRLAPRLRRASVLWVGVGGLAILLASLLYHLKSGRAQPPGLIALLTPANLFTGVLACGLICLLTVWMEWRFVPRGARLGAPLAWLSLVGGLAFVGLGLKGYWDHSRWTAFLILGGTLAVGWLAARWRARA